uniref:Uncharacterized protein n=1 Tax=Spodoptera frugiperda nuclear polyhedrosis virus TaxID=10455 RepID=A0A7G3W7W8_NPVSF|nr:hypothetical protein [Spodoptera frugiperda multiple nucleopolyhedrovirus]
MNVGTVCLCVDSCLLLTKKIHSNVVQTICQLDFEKGTPNLVPIRKSLIMLRNNLDYLYVYIKNNLDQKDKKLNEFINSVVVKELNDALYNYMNDIQILDEDMKNIEVCSHMMFTLKSFNKKNFQLHLEINDYNLTYTFINMINVHVLPPSKLFNYVVDKINYMQRVCDRIHARLYELETIYIMVNMATAASLDDNDTVYKATPKDALL